MQRYCGENTGRKYNSEISGQIATHLKMHLCRVHMHIFDQICKQEKDKKNLKRKSYAKHVMSAGLSSSSACTSRTFAYAQDV